MAIELNFGDRAGPPHFGSNDNIWDIDLIYRIESECILNKLKSLANTKEPPPWKDDIEKKIKDKYCEITTDMVIIPDNVLEEVVGGFYRDQAPSESSIRMWSIAFWIAVLAESSVLLIQGLFSADFNPFIIVLAVILALGGYFQGKGLGMLFYRSWLHSINKAPLARDQEWWLIGAGTALIVLVSLMRAYGSFEPLQFLLVFLITFFFGEAVAISEAMYVKKKEQRNRCLNEQLNAQRFHATRVHSNKMEEYRKYYETKQSKKYPNNISRGDIQEQQSEPVQVTK